jgi:energy-coupling factor transporter transmembrane protein EcfT
MNKKQSIVRIATAVWVIGLVLTLMALSVPPANVPLYIGLACIAIIPLVFGSRRYRIFAVIALAFSLLLAIGEHNAGIIHKEKMERLRQYWATNAPPTNPQKP